MMDQPPTSQPDRAVRPPIFTSIAAVFFMLIFFPLGLLIAIASFMRYRKLRGTSARLKGFTFCHTDARHLFL